LQTFRDLEKKLSYEDIRFYRSITRSRLRKDMALRKRLEEEKKKHQAQASQGWTAWLWGSSQKEQTQEDPLFGGQMTTEQRKELYDVLDYDEKAALVESFQTPRDALRTRIAAKLHKGSLALKTNRQGNAEDILSVVFNLLQANVIQRPDNFEASVSLGGFGVFDATTKNSLHPQIVHVKGVTGVGGGSDNVSEDPFFFVKFENKPLDERADTALTVRLRHTEVVYHRGYVEAVYKFFKPPASQLESVEALLVSGVNAACNED
jgi:vacuolar protein sorting-associated protein 13A/C